MPAISALRERPRGRVAVELDGAPWRVLPAEAVVRAGLAVGRELDRDRARALARELRRARALGRATRALASASRSRRELEERLERAGVPAAAREEALGSLERAGLVDDARVALARAGSLAGRGYGDAAIRADLARRGIPPEDAAAAVAELEPEEVRARRTLERGGVSGRSLRRLAGRGFSRETLEAVSSFADEA